MIKPFLAYNTDMIRLKRKPWFIVSKSTQKAKNLLISAKGFKNKIFN
jgi:hypothetical protein